MATTKPTFVGSEADLRNDKILQFYELPKPLNYIHAQTRPVYKVNQQNNHT